MELKHKVYDEMKSFDGLIEPQPEVEVLRRVFIPSLYVPQTETLFRMNYILF